MPPSLRDAQALPIAVPPLKKSIDQKEPNV
jgi:hypothetical protein